MLATIYPHGGAVAPSRGMLLPLVLLRWWAVGLSARAPAAAAPKTLLHYGYYYGLSPRDGLAGFANHSTTTFVLNSGSSGTPPTNNITLLAEKDIADLMRLKALNMTGILYSVQSVFGSQAQLSKTWQADLALYWQLLKPHSANILAWYPADEPTQLQVASLLTLTL